MSPCPHQKQLSSLVDVALLRSWLHQSRKARSVDVATASPARDMFAAGFRLIDCHALCTTKVDTPCEYLALSYVWGARKASWQFANTQNIHDLSKPNALSLNASSTPRLPRIIHEAIQLTVKLGHRYLWVDAICILQDDANEKRHVMDRMDLVYKGAFATILIPGCTSSDDSIPGLFRPRLREAARGVKFSVHIADQKVRIASHFAPSNYVQLGRHATRAWTLQEQVFSARVLAFCEGEAFLCTANHTWRENGPPSGCKLSADADSFGDLPAGCLHSPNEEIELAESLGLRSFSDDQGQGQGQGDAEDRHAYYGQLVHQYASRTVSHGEDYLNAFSGIYNHLYRERPSCQSIHVTQGIASDLLPASLNWHMSSGSRGRRLMSKDGIFSTWTWVGSIGRVYTPRYNEICLAGGFVFGEEVKQPHGNDAVACQLEARGNLTQLSTASAITKMLLHCAERMLDMSMPKLIHKKEICFWACCVNFSDLRGIVTLGDSPGNPGYYTIFVDDQEPAGTIYPDHEEWIEPAEMVCLNASKTNDGVISGLLIERSRGFNRRIGTFDSDDDLLFDRIATSAVIIPEWKYVVLR